MGESNQVKKGKHQKLSKQINRDRAKPGQILIVPVPKLDEGVVLVPGSSICQSMGMQTMSL